jgi:hypothetical protein
LWRRAWRRAVRTLGSVVLRRELRVFGSVLPMRVMRRVEKSVRELWWGGSGIVGSVRGDFEGDGVVDV